MRLSAIDRKILNCIQGDIPLTPEPFKVLAERLGLEERELLQRVRKLKKRQIIRRFSAGVNHRKLGFISSLIALKVPLNKVEGVVKRIIAYPEITHCYLREGEYNIWVVFISLEKKKMGVFLNGLANQLGRENILNLRTKKQFKLKTALKV